MHAAMWRALPMVVVVPALAIASARASSPAPMPLQPADAFALHTVSDVQISPDARHVAYVRETPDIMTDRFKPDIWLVDAAGQNQRQLAGSASEPRWSPDGSTIAYVAGDGSGHQRIFLFPVDGKTSPRALTDDTTSPGEIAWNRDGSAIAYTAFVAAKQAGFAIAMLARPPGASWAPPPRIITASSYQADGAGFLPPGQTGLFVVSTRTGVTTSVQTGDIDVGGVPSWTPDGSALVFSAHETGGLAAPEADALYRTTLATGRTTRLSTGTGFDTGATVSPDGNTIAYVHVSKGSVWHPAAWAMRSDGQHPHPLLSALDRDVSQLHWTHAGLFVSYEDRGAGTIARITSTRHADPVVSQGDGDDFSLADDGSVGFALGSPACPTAAAISDHAGQRALTHLDDELLRQRTLGTFSSFDTTSSYDGETVPGFIIRPPHAQPGHRYPTILWIHGGPYGDDGPQWSTNLQLLAAAGYVVIDTNPRGSRSYGFAHTDKLPFGAPGHDYDDLMSVVDAAVARGIADPARLYVTGSSYGGIMTSWIVGRTTRFRAAVAGKPAVVAVSWLATDQYENLSNDPRGLPWGHPDAWWRSSPLSLVGHVATPTMVFVGEDDRRTPITQAEIFYDALRLRGVPSALVLYPEASHETLGGRPSQLVSIVTAMLDWFGRYG